jgi:hypothetical protein
MISRVDNWIVLALDRKKWRDVVNTVMNLWIPYNKEDFLTVKKMFLEKDSDP